MSSPALITGVSGQDGAYLAALLLAQGHPVIGTLRRVDADAAWRLRALRIDGHPNLRLIELDIENVDACMDLLAECQPAALFHLAAQSRVADSFRDPLASARINGLGALHLLEAIRLKSPHTRFVLASSAELFGDASVFPQNESTPFLPRNPYAVAKQFAHAATVSHRMSFGLHASCAILFNHESPLRDEAFVTQKIVAAAVRLARGEGDPLTLGNLDARRDFGYAPEYVAAMATMAGQTTADDYVLGAGIATSIREFAEQAFLAAGLSLRWRGQGLDEQAFERDGSRLLIRVDPAFFRPLDAALLVGDSSKARARLGFAPDTGVAALARLMVAARRHDAT